MEEKKFRKEQRRAKREAREAKKREREWKAGWEGDDLDAGETKTKKAKKSKKTKKRRKEAKDVRKDDDADDEGNYVGDDEHEDGKKPRRKSKQSTGSDSESHDSEIERLFQDSQDLSGKSPSDGKAKNSRKVKRGASKSSKSQETSNVTFPEESVHSNSADGPREESLRRDKSHDEAEPPTDIHMRNDPLQKGVSEVTISLAASLRTSEMTMPNQLEGIRDQEKSNIDGDESERNVKTGAAKKRKSKKAESPSEEIQADDGVKHMKRGKKGHTKKVDRRVMLRAMSSIRASLTKLAVADLESSSSDDLNSSSDEDDSENEEEKRVAAKKKTPSMGKSSSEVAGRDERRKRGNNDLGRSGRRQAMMKAMASVRSSFTNFGGADSKSNKRNDKNGDISSAEENETPKPAKRMSKKTSKSTGKADPPDSNGSEPKKARPSFKSKAQSLRSSLTKFAARDDENDSSSSSSSSSGGSSSSESDSSSSSSDSSDGRNDRIRRPSLKKKPSAGKTPLLQDNMRRKSSTGSNANVMHSLSRKQSSNSRREFNSSYGSKASSRGSKRDSGARSRSGKATDANGKRELKSSDGDEAYDTNIPHKLSATDYISSPPYPYQQSKPKFLGRRASVDTKASESEQTRTNDYLPHGLDCQPHHLLPPPESSLRNEALLRSRSRGSKTSLKSGSSKSLGSKSRSGSDLNSAHGSVRSKTGSTKSKLSLDKSARSQERTKLSNSKKHAKSPRAPTSKVHKRSKDTGKPLRRSKTRPSLEQFKSSLTNSVSSLKGKKLSKLAESALDSSEDHVAANPPKPSKAKSKKSSKKRPSTSQPTPENEVSSSRRSSRPSHSSRGGAREP